MNIYLRPLKISDAEISVKWRNDPEVWKFTGARPEIYIDSECEKNWLKNILNKKDQIRFAICIKDSNQYIGNIQLTDINKTKGQFHIFIGEKKYWNKGIGSQATKIFLIYIFSNTSIKDIYLYVKKDNIIARRIYEKNNFYKINENDINVLMNCNKSEYMKKII